MTKRTCNACMLAFFIDYGYSNYTTEGTTFHCGVDKHPDGNFDRFYGHDKRLCHATFCEYFVEGKPIEMDVERENLQELKMTPAQLILWREKFDKL